VRLSITGVATRSKVSKVRLVQYNETEKEELTESLLVSTNHSSSGRRHSGPLIALAGKP
jgi:hypothetical protein